MATIEEMVETVIEDTRRPDKASLITQSVKSAILRAHRREYFARDIIVAEYVNPEDFTQTDGVIVVELPPRFRKFAKIEQLLDTGYPLYPPVIFNLAEANNNGIDWGSYYRTTAGKAYIRGNNFIISYPTIIDRFYAEYYADPLLVEMTASTWITDQYEQVIVDGAKAMLYRRLGDRETAAGYVDLFREGIETIVADHLLPII